MLLPLSSRTTRLPDTGDRYGNPQLCTSDGRVDQRTYAELEEALDAGPQTDAPGALLASRHISLLRIWTTNLSLHLGYGKTLRMM